MVVGRKSRPQLDLFGGASPAKPAAVEEAPADPREPEPSVPPVPTVAEPMGATGPKGGSDRIRAAIQSRLAGESPPRAGGPEGGGPQVVTVGELARQIRGSLEGRFGFVHVRGEISNLRQPGSGHLYFSLKDEQANLRAVLFRGQARLLRFRPENGQEVVARGRVSFYDTAGDTQLVCEGLEPVGMGALALAFEQRKNQLAAEGLFARERKRPLPFLPRCIGVVTSPTGAAIRDFLRVLHRRFPGMAVRIAPARVQGEGAAEEIAIGIRRLVEKGGCDVIVVTRGGGSIEDLWAFNEEILARAIAASPIPVVSAVGHEVDFTIADFVADVRAPTPTAAAELLAPVEIELRSNLAVTRTRLARAMIRLAEARRARVHRQQARMGDPARRIGDARIRLDGCTRRAEGHLRRRLLTDRRHLVGLQERLRNAHPAVQLRKKVRDAAQLRERLHRSIGSRLATEEQRLEASTRRLLRRNPKDRILAQAGRLGQLEGRLAHLGERLLERERGAVADLRSRLDSLSPLRVLARGYAVAFSASGAVLLSAGDVVPGDRIHLELADGALAVDVVGPVPDRKGASGRIDRDGSRL